jgi:hypothetical protein
MKLYILSGVVNYEGEMAIGVYSSREEAKVHMKEYMERNDDIIFDDYCIREKILGAPAVCNI